MRGVRHGLLSAHPAVACLGEVPPEHRLPIVSFNIRVGSSSLHPRFVATLLNDLFGIQSRAGCSCAALYHVWECRAEAGPASGWSRRLQALPRRCCWRNNRMQPGSAGSLRRRYAGRELKTTEQDLVPFVFMDES